jgi:hypothetical protein
MNSWHTFDNYGYALFKVPAEVMEILGAERAKHGTSEIFPKYINATLAGQISKEYEVSHLKNLVPVKSFLDNVAKIYVDTFNVAKLPSEVVDIEASDWDIVINRLWMNIQERGEYNPVHIHGGVISFVIWFEIPYDLDEEKALNNSRYSNQPSNGDFFFHPINTLGQFTSVPMHVGKDKEGTICVFHAKLAHSVNPFFTTDKQRVTFSGNFSYKKRENKEPTTQSKEFQ